MIPMGILQRSHMVTWHVVDHGRRAWSAAMGVVAPWHPEDWK